MRTHRSLLAVAASVSALLGAGCQDLDVLNPNEADRARATKQPAAVESFVATSFSAWWPATQDDYPAWVTSTVADEFTSGFADFGQLETSSEPRQAWNNSPVSNRADVNEDPWYEWYGVISTVNDALIAIDGGMVIVDDERTARATAFGKFMQALGHGYIALIFDQGYIVDESVIVDEIPSETAADSLKPSTEVMAAAIAQMEEAIAIAEANEFELDQAAWVYMDLTNAEFVQLMHSYLARFKAYMPRTRAERDAAPWDEILAHIDAGITWDFAPQAVPDVIFGDFKRLVARVRNVERPGDFGRADYWLVGPADSTSRFLDWVATPVLDRDPFRLQTTDRRIQGPTLGSIGLYFGYNPQTLFRADRGTYHRSFYYFHRFGTGDSWQSGPQVAMTVTEMNLLKAEALIRRGGAADIAEAVDLINLTRVANGQLPPVTADGPPVEQGCVPRKLDGSCGSLWDALRYEKRIEMAGVDPTVAYFDARGWQTLLENSFVQLPIPGRELEILQLPLYTFGGGLEGSAPAPDPERCPGPAVLARCP